MNDYFRREQEAFFANYFPKERTGDSVVYIHKKYLKTPPEGRADASPKFDSEKRVDNTERNPAVKHDKSRQLTNEIRTKKIKTSNEDNTKAKAFNDDILEQTIKFAKDLALGIPDRDKDKYFYTVRVGKKIKKTRAKSQTETFWKEINRQSVTYRHSSTKESTHTTIEELHINQSLSCSLSEISVRKQSDRELIKTNGLEYANRSQTKQNELIASESIQALATVLAGTCETKIKIHLMDDAEKLLLVEGLRNPLIKTIKDCIKELNENKDEKVKEVQKVVKDNSLKIDYILNKISNIDSKLINTEIRSHANQKSVGVNTNADHKQIKEKKAISKSKLEELEQDEGEDDIITSEDLTEEQEKIMKPDGDEIHIRLPKSSARSNMGSGEVGMPLEPKTIAKLIKPARPNNKIPARFCWTDVSK